VPEVDQLELKARVEEILIRRPAVGLAVGVVRHGSLEFFQGHGVADIASSTPVTEDTVFRIASITKTFTAIAVLQLCEQGLVDLDAPANDYLRAYQLIPAKAGFRPARHLAVEHEGILPGFNSDIFVAPDDGVGVMAFTNGARQAMLWLPAEVGRLLSHLLGVPDDVIRTDVPQHPEVWGDICGSYRFSAPLTDLRARSMFGAGAEVLVRRGQLTLRAVSPIPALYKGFVLHTDDAEDPYVFRIDLSEFGIGTARVIFTRDPEGTTRVHLDLYPLSLQKPEAAQHSQPETVDERTACRRRHGARHSPPQEERSSGTGRLLEPRCAWLARDGPGASNRTQTSRGDRCSR